MAYPALAPNATQMKGYLAKGLTQQQIADQWEKDTGIRVSRAAIGMAISRYGLTPSRTRARFDDLIPWKVSQEHRYLRDAAMLRLEGRRRKGLPMTDKERRLLTTWMSELQDANAVVMYHPDTDQGWFWVTRKDIDDDIIRRPENVGA